MYDTHYEEYKVLKAKYKIGWGNDAEPDCDIILAHAGYGYACTKYRIIKNAPKLSKKQLAIICDSGNLCFGWHDDCGLIAVHTD